MLAKRNVKLNIRCPDQLLKRLIHPFLGSLFWKIFGPLTLKTILLKIDLYSTIQLTIWWILPWINHLIILFHLIKFLELLSLKGLKLFEHVRIRNQSKVILAKIIDCLGLDLTLCHWVNQNIVLLVIQIFNWAICMFQILHWPIYQVTTILLSLWHIIQIFILFWFL